MKNSKNRVFNKTRKTVYISIILIICILISPIFKTKSFTFSEITPIDNNVTFERVIMQNEEQKELNTNGAGCQWPVSLEASNDGSLMLYGIDVAGLYKSTDNGETWVMANSGMESRGVGMFAIDPYNSNHVLALGLGKSIGGMHVSYDKATTWKKTASLKSYGERYLWDGLEFDPSSYDSASNITKDVYYSTPYKRDTGIRKSPTETPTVKGSLQENEVGLYKSTDGGETFTLIINDERLADAIIKITDSGDVYVGNQYGLFLINKENASISKTYLENDPTIDYSKGITGLDVVNNTIYAQTWDGIYTLENDVLTKITNENYINRWPQFLEVSKSNPNHMIYQARQTVDNYYVSSTTVSFDGGQTWQSSTAERNSLFFKSNWEGREKLSIIDPTDDNNVLTFGSDDLLKSTDGGLHFKQVKGMSNMMQGGKFNFNYYDPDLLLFSAQDYTGVISTDGGTTYKQLSIPNKGNFYGGFAADADTIYGFANESWNGGTLTHSHDGGDTWTDTGLTVTAIPSATYYSSLQSPTNPNVLFACEYYSKDKGYTWNKMTGCISVYTFNYINEKELYGTDINGNIVVSYDNGDNWIQLSDFHWNKSSNLTKQTILDLAYDQVNNYAYAVVQSLIADSKDNTKIYTLEEIYKYDITNKTASKLNIPVDNERGYMRQKSIAIDPNSTSVIYVGGAGDYYSSSTGLLRSIDGGNTWSVLTTANNDKYQAKATNQGGYEISNVRVNPYDGRVWISCGCYGYETFNPPYDSSLLNNTKPQAHTITYMYNDKKVNEVTIKNNYKHNYIYEENNLTFVSWYTDKELTQEFPNGSVVYDSMTLYAKMEKSIKVKFYDRNVLLWKIDLDEYNAGNENQIPTRNGYAFAGWYTDSNLTQKVDFSSITSNTKVYAGWYKIQEDVFDINKKDISNYINYSTLKIQDAKEVDNTEKVNDRCIHMGIDKNSTYYISFKMDNRFRLGMRKNSFKYWPWNPVLESYIDERDNNGKKNVNEYVYKVIDTNDYTDLLIYYYSWNGTQDFMDIKNTFKIYKLENSDIHANNENIDGPEYSIIEGANQTYTINIDNGAKFRSDSELLNFDYAEIDGETIDSSNYELESGSTIITFKKEFMDTLKSNEEHILNLVFKDGREASATFNVLFANIENDDNNQNNENSENSEEAGENSNSENTNNQGNNSNNNNKQNDNSENNNVTKNVITNGAIPVTGDNIYIYMILFAVSGICIVIRKKLFSKGSKKK